MADLARAEELVQTLDRDAGFRADVEAAPTVAAKRGILDAHGYQDVTLDDMKAWVASKGGKLVAQPGGRELTDEELGAVAGGMTGEEIGYTVGGAVFGLAVIGGMAAIAAG